MLKLIINNSAPFCRDALFQRSEEKVNNLKSSLERSCLFDCREISSNLYVFRFFDLSHELACEMFLELKENFAYSDEASEEESHLVPVIACDFPLIDIQKLQEKVLEDEYLQGMLMIQFQLKILEQLLLFCDDKEATHLILNFNEANLDYLEIYQRFLISEEEVITAKGEQTEIVIPTDVENYDNLIDFMDKVGRDFQQTLWREQRSNPAFRQYLTSQSLLEF